MLEAFCVSWVPNEFRSDVAMTLGVAAEGVLKSKATEEILMHAMQSTQMT